MSSLKINPHTIILLLIIGVIVMVRIAVNLASDAGPVSDFTPIGAMAIFGGACFTGRIKPYVFPLLALFFSDMLLSFTVYADFRSGLLYTGWYWTYGAFALMVLVGKTMSRNISAQNVLLAVIAATLIHWLISDIGGCLHEETTGAIIKIYGQRLITAIPYELKFLAGTLIYSAIMFGSLEWMIKKAGARFSMQ